MSYIRFFFGTPTRFLVTCIIVAIFAVALSPELQQSLMRGLDRIMHILFNQVLLIAIMVFAICKIVMAPFKKGGTKK
ncbi:MAG TPA: hypothetical protein DCX32_02955 [Candidatus Moranbacteria bacterium]|nr:hypothetical protein [Candidatus Moranbacteria bacterium]